MVSSRRPLILLGAPRNRLIIFSDDPMRGRPSRFLTWGLSHFVSLSLFRRAFSSHFRSQTPSQRNVHGEFKRLWGQGGDRSFLGCRGTYMMYGLAHRVWMAVATWWSIPIGMPTDRLTSLPCDLDRSFSCPLPTRTLIDGQSLGPGISSLPSLLALEL